MLTYNCGVQVWTIDEWSVETKSIQNYYLFKVKLEAGRFLQAELFC